MGKVTAGATVSLDGHIAGPDETGFEHLFAWFAGGDVEFPSANPGVGPSIRLTEPDHRYLRDVVDGIGVFVVGRRLFDLTDGWGGTHPFDKPVVVVTHGRAPARTCGHARVRGRPGNRERAPVHAAA